MLQGQLNQVTALAPAAKALQRQRGHSLQQVPAPRKGSATGGVHILATAATAPSAAPLLAASAAHTRQVQPGIPVQHPPPQGHRCRGEACSANAT